MHDKTIRGSRDDGGLVLILLGLLLLLVVWAISRQRIQIAALRFGSGQAFSVKFSDTRSHFCFSPRSSLHRLCGKSGDSGVVHATIWHLGGRLGGTLLAFLWGRGRYGGWC